MIWFQSYWGLFCDVVHDLSWSAIEECVFGSGGMLTVFSSVHICKPLREGAWSSCVRILPYLLVWLFLSIPEMLCLVSSKTFRQAHLWQWGNSNTETQKSEVLRGRGVRLKVRAEGGWWGDWETGEREGTMMPWLGIFPEHKLWTF